MFIVVTETKFTSDFSISIKNKSYCNVMCKISTDVLFFFRPEAGNIATTLDFNPLDRFTPDPTLRTFTHN